MQKIYQANPESYNGAIRDNYSWSQSITDVDVRVKVGNFVHSNSNTLIKMQLKVQPAPQIRVGSAHQTLYSV